METIVEVKQRDINDFLEMASALWPEEDKDELRSLFLDIIQSSEKKVLLYQTNEKFVAFVYITIRKDYVEGSSSSPTGFVEGIYVKPGYRKKGIARMLVRKGEQWLKEMGIRQIGSDILIENQESYQFHTQIGFKEAARLIAFIKDLN